MAILFTPSEIDFHKIALKEIEYEHEDVVLTTEMDKDSHQRGNGTPSIKLVNFTAQMSQEQYQLFSEWTAFVGAGNFYSTFPDPFAFGIDTKKYYNFTFPSTAFKPDRINSFTIQVDITVKWHYRVEPMERI